MKRFVFDAETTGVLNKNLPLEHPEQPRVVQLAGIMVNSHWQELNSFSFVVKPDGFEVPEEAVKIHGITTDMANLLGLPLLTVLSVFNNMVHQAHEVWAFNAHYDVSVLRGEFLRLNRPYAMDARAARCAMLECKDILKLPGPYGYKWPKLSEAYAYFFNGAEIDKAHDALADVRATAKVMQAMQDMADQEEFQLDAASEMRRTP